LVEGASAARWCVAQLTPTCGARESRERAVACGAVVVAVGSCARVGGVKVCARAHHGRVDEREQRRREPDAEGGEAEGGKVAQRGQLGARRAARKLDGGLGRRYRHGDLDARRQQTRVGVEGRALKLKLPRVARGRRVRVGVGEVGLDEARDEAVDGDRLGLEGRHRNGHLVERRALLRGLVEGLGA
jgi:hypothetical protein